MFDNVEIPFGVPDALGAAMGFMSLYQGWILLGTGIVIAIVIISILFWLQGKTQRAARVSAILNRGEVRTIEMDWKVGKNGRMEGREIYGRN